MDGDSKYSPSPLDLLIIITTACHLLCHTPCPTFWALGVI